MFEKPPGRFFQTRLLDGSRQRGNTHRQAGQFQTSQQRLRHCCPLGRLFRTPTLRGHSLLCPTVIYRGPELPGIMVEPRRLMWPWANGVLTAFFQAGLETGCVVRLLLPSCRMASGKLTTPHHLSASSVRRRLWTHRDLRSRHRARFTCRSGLRPGQGGILSTTSHTRGRLGTIPSLRALTSGGRPP